MAKVKVSKPRQLATGPWRIHVFARHRDDDPEETAPAQDYLDECPVAPRILAVVRAVADAPPPAFSGGGKWEAMHGAMNGYYEVRVDGPKRRHYRLFCILERDGALVGLGGPSLVLITGMEKAFRSTFTEEDYAQVRVLGTEYRSRNPRSVTR